MFNDDDLQQFLEEREIVEFVDHFFTFEKLPYLTIIVSYRDKVSRSGKTVDRKKDPRRELDEQEKKLYDTLKSWRAVRASQEGIPPYLIANNRQIACMIKLNAKNKIDFSEIKGFGEARIDKYGDDIIKVLVQQQDPDPDVEPKTNEGEE